MENKEYGSVVNRKSFPSNSALHFIYNIFIFIFPMLRSISVLHFTAHRVCEFSTLVDLIMDLVCGAYFFCKYLLYSPLFSTE